MAEKVRRLVLERILSREQIHHVLSQSLGEDVRWALKSSEVKPAMDGIAGFLSEHMKAVLYVEVEGEVKDVHLFWKCLPVDNKAKADFIDGQHYFGREALVYKLMEEMPDEDPTRFSVRAYIYTDSIIVMPDLTIQGYACRPYRDTLDPAHVFVTTTSIAQFHAAFVNYETNKSVHLQRPYSIFQEFRHLITEPIFCDSPWLKAAAKLSTNLLKTFSEKSYRDLPDLETKLFSKYVEACDSLKEYEDTVNSLLHRDLWINNIMFKYENEVPTNAIIIDFQNLRYGPPAFDLMTFLYLTTDKSFRDARESEVFDHYYTIFTDNLNDTSKRRLVALGYDREAFLKWCEKGRMFGMIEAIGLFPYVLLDPKTAEKTFNFDDLETHEKNFNEDRSEMILAYCLKCETFKQRNLDACEEFAETYLKTANSNMVGEARQLFLEDVLDVKQINHIVNQSIGEDVAWVLKGSEVRPAVDGIAGCLGEHMKAVLNIDVKGEIKNVHLFIKRIPVNNKPKADYIDAFNFFKRETLMYSVLENSGENGLNPWCLRAYIHTDSLIVMPDVTRAGYTCRHFLETLDSEHVFLSIKSIARFHATVVNYETKKSIDLKRPYNTFQEFGHILNESSFRDGPWLRAAAKLSSNLLKTFSTKSYRNLPDLESKLYKLFVKACDTLTEYEDSVNVLIHKDLWVSNIMFKYDNSVPTSALLIDFQCMRYVPPAFDLMIFLYLTTDRRFREQHEKVVFDKYYSTFIENLSSDSKKRIEGLGYDKENFLKWCEKARMVGIFDAITIYPFILMDPKTAQKAFDDPETFEEHTYNDRSKPVLGHAVKCEIFKTRNLEVTEDFVERYVLN